MTTDATIGAQVDATNYGIFDSFESDEARQAHIEGEIPKALAQIGGDLLAKEPDIKTVDVVVAK
jgi:quinol monooxygenase YgiN